jgi:hypothetical protein
MLEGDLVATFKDLSTYTYLASTGSPLNIGWLGRDMEFET